MLLVIDIGNTNIVFGLFQADTLVCQFRLESDRGRQSAFYAAALRDSLAKFTIMPGMIQNIAMASVVPQLDEVIASASFQLFARKPFAINAKACPGIRILYESVDSLGADRIVNAVAAYDKYKSAAIAIDMGTATTFDYVDDNGSYHGGAIAPGIGTAAEALFQKAAMLPRIDLAYPERVIGQSTVQCMQSGIVTGYVCMVDGMIERINSEAGSRARVIATGGLARLVAPHCRCIDDIDEHLLLRGIKIIHERSTT